jgi:hypothetical protein
VSHECHWTSFSVRELDIQQVCGDIRGEQKVEDKQRRQHDHYRFESSSQAVQMIPIVKSP